MFAAILFFALLFRAGGPSTIEGVVLRAQEVSASGAAPVTRMLLSTGDGLCAVRIPGEAGEWASYADAEVEIRGELRDGEFVVAEESDISILKYPSTDPSVLRDVLPAGEFVRRRIQRRNAVLAVCGVAAAALAILLVGVRAVRNRRLARFFMGRVAYERRRTGVLHEDVEQQLEGVRLLLQNALAFTPGVPDEVAEAVRTASQALAEAKGMVHRTAAAAKPLDERRRT